MSYFTECWKTKLLLDNRQREDSMAKGRYSTSHIVKANAIKNNIKIICVSGKCTF